MLYRIICVLKLVIIRVNISNFACPLLEVFNSLIFILGNHPSPTSMVRHLGQSFDEGITLTVWITTFLFSTSLSVRESLLQTIGVILLWFIGFHIIAQPPFSLPFLITLSSIERLGSTPYPPPKWIKYHSQS